MSTYARITTLNKENVEALLSMNENNRKVKRRVVARYKRDMENGRWRLTSQGIGVSSEGVLIDGQHRLIAAREAGYPAIEAVVVYGLDPESQKVVDQHAKRSARDVFRLASDVTISKYAPAILNVLARFEKSVHIEGRANRSEQLSVDELLGLYDQYAEAIESISEVFKDHGLAASYLAPGVQFVYEQPYVAGKVVRFYKDLKSGENLNRSMPVYHLRNHMLTTRSGNGGGSLALERYAKTKKALTAFLNNRPMGVLRA